MMHIPFVKYQGTGNDFVLIDNRQTQWLARGEVKRIERLCDRRFGIGADGLILLENHPDCDFEMVYFNADGRESSMCGNGGRCIVQFAHHLGAIENSCRFLAIDGYHDALVRSDGWIELKMSKVTSVEKGEDYYLLNTGSPHYVIFAEDLDDIDVVANGQAIRYSKRFRAEGVNVNFVERRSDGILVATYERGVEGETLSCGTGVTAAAICHYLDDPSPLRQLVGIQSKGGPLQVRFQAQADGVFEDIWLCGPAVRVFEGEVVIQ
ncbi:MAG: diaminopimelate epimerase [Bacteroidota bacterium]